MRSELIERMRNEDSPAAAKPSSPAAKVAP
jgi:hypothetical protein